MQNMINIKEVLLQWLYKKIICDKILKLQILLFHCTKWFYFVWKQWEWIVSVLRKILQTKILVLKEQNKID